MDIKEHEKLVKERMEALKTGEARGASGEGSPDSSTGETPKEEKAKGIIDKAEAEAKELFEKPEEELTDEQKKRKAGILEKRKQSNLDKRFAELTGKIKDLERDKEANKAEIERLRAEKDMLEQRIKEPSDSDILAKWQEERIGKIVEEDKAKPREQRREMPKEELEEWLLEDYAAATEWIIERNLRRKSEAAQDQFKLNQGKSFMKVLKKHPELNLVKRREELAKEGKTPQEIENILMQDNEKYRTICEILKENPHKYEDKENGPELLAKEMEERLKGTDKDSEKEELHSQIEELKAEIERLKNVDTSPSSTRGTEPPKTEPEDPRMKHLEKIAAKAGIPFEKVKERIKEREKIPGVGSLFK